MTGLLAGKNILVTGVITDASIAYSVAELAQEQGANVILTGFGRMSLVQKIAQKLSSPPPVIELDVTDEDQLESLADRIRELGITELQGVVHAVAFGPKDVLGENFVDGKWSDVSTTFQVSTWSLASLVKATQPLLTNPASVVGLDFDATVAWPAYGWMGVAKAGLESASRYLARQLGADGIRINLVSAGPLRTIAAKGIPGFVQFEDSWQRRAPLGWDVNDTKPAGRAVVALLSDWFPATTGEIVHVDGGYHAVGA